MAEDSTFTFQPPKIRCFGILQHIEVDVDATFLKENGIKSPFIIEDIHVEDEIL